MKLYMAVTPDRYELPLAPPDTAKNLAELFGTTPNNIWHRSAIKNQEENVKELIITMILVYDLFWLEIFD
ncbi:hypothetical protein DXB04_27755 [Enterocloster bolteae]|nr:hypothetical protein DXB04_27755 [Enterocloster bolteae]